MNGETKFIKYPNITIPKNTVRKNAASNLSFIAPRRIIASGKLIAETDIKNAMEVPSGMGLLKNISAIGTTPAQLPYIGAPKSATRGTLKMPAAFEAFNITESGI
jgi:hypothetical protein